MSQSPAPRHLGSSYIMETRIGAGAQGEVWRGRRTDARETLAFKVLRAELVENPDVVERFIKERSTLLRVRSPYVVAIRDVVIEGSTFAIVMDYVNGGDLRDLLRSHGSLPPAQVASLGYGGFLLGPPAIGFVADHFGLRAALGIALLGAVLVAVLSATAFRLVRKTQSS